MATTTLRQPTGCRVRVVTKHPAQVRMRGRFAHVSTGVSPIR